MEREIKFRVFNEDDEMDYSKDHSWASFNADYNPDTYHFMQFTGLKDKNGKEIYEGDIISWGNGLTQTIEYKIKDVSEVYGHGHSGVNSTSGFIVDGYYGPLKDVEIIGNVHQNPELIPN